MNKVILMGRLTRDAEIRYAQGDNSLAIARFSLAVDRRYSKNAEEQSTDFINCVAFGKIAEFFERFGRKGTKFVVEGRIQTGSYTNKDGQKVYTTDVVVENAEFAESKSAASGNAGDGILTSLKMMEVMMARKQKMSQLCEGLSIYPQVLQNVRVADKAEALANPEVQAAVDQVTAELGDTGRILVRESGTEPVIRVMVEAESEEICQKYVDMVVAKLK